MRWHTLVVCLCVLLLPPFGACSPSVDPVGDAGERDAPRDAGESAHDAGQYRDGGGAADAGANTCPLSRPDNLSPGCGAARACDYGETQCHCLEGDTPEDQLWICNPAVCDDTPVTNGASCDLPGLACAVGPVVTCTCNPNDNTWFCCDVCPECLTVSDCPEPANEADTAYCHNNECRECAYEYGICPEVSDECISWSQPFRCGGCDMDFSLSANQCLNDMTPLCGELEGGCLAPTPFCVVTAGVDNGECYACRVDENDCLETETCCAGTCQPAGDACPNDGT